jgi:hypothetical protein
MMFLRTLGETDLVSAAMLFDHKDTRVGGAERYARCSHAEAASEKAMSGARAIGHGCHTLG